MKDCARYPKPFTGGDASIKLRDLSSLQRGDNLPSSDGRVKLRCLVKSLPGGRDLLSLGRGPRGRHRGDIGGWGVAISCESEWCIIVQNFFLCLYFYLYNQGAISTVNKYYYRDKRKCGALTKDHDTKKRIPGT